MTDSIPTDAERSVAAALLWDEALDDLTAEEFRDLVRRVTQRLIADGWSPSSPTIPYYPNPYYPNITWHPCQGCQFPCGNTACPQRTIITYGTNTSNTITFKKPDDTGDDD